MTENATRYIPELEYFFTKYWERERNIYINDIKLPYLETLEFRTDSVLYLLFNNVYSYEYYNNKCKQVNIDTYFSKPIRDRLHTNSLYIYAYLSDLNGDEYFIENNEENINSLNLLLQYRLFNDITFTSEEFSYDELENKISKLIYIYLDCMINDNYNQIINLTISNNINDTLIENLFEIYVINEIYKKIKNSEYIENSQLVNLNQGRHKQLITVTDIENKYISVENDVYLNSDYYLYINGEFILTNKYEILDNNKLSWEGMLLEELINENDVIIFDYYYRKLV